MPATTTSAAATTTPVAPPPAGRFDADPIHSSVGFAVRHMGLSTFRGSFSHIWGRLDPGADGRIALEGGARAESISIVSPPEFRAHVLGEEFLDAARHPELTFRSDDLRVGEDGGVVAEGTLTIKGITRPIAVTGTYVPPVADPYGGERAALELTAAIDRRDFEMRWNAPLPNGGDALAAEVRLSVALELVRAA